ncbi:MAG: aminoacyl-tRNA hydrolase [Patescibacteria group bacterium]|nr:aminoacyl-tRNA hydrolase [Patescibacteria group bacterium]MDE2172846.1 aminoacyl-tRNA hydrolase [Patescibacteria group bacterium]
MSYIIVGLGNPGEAYEGTRHNAGRMILDNLRQSIDAAFEFDKKKNAQIAVGKIGAEKVTLVAPDTFMNNSGKAVAMLVKSAKAAEKLIVIYDDFNLPLGRIRISYDRGDGGHNGLASIIKSLRTTAFARIRLGTAPENVKGQAKVPHGEEKIEKFILGPFRADELKTLKAASKKAVGAVEMIVTEGREKAMSLYNAG